jgi:hypothetical protein
MIAFAKQPSNYFQTFAPFCAAVGQKKQDPDTRIPIRVDFVGSRQAAAHMNYYIEAHSCVVFLFSGAFYPE